MEIGSKPSEKVFQARQGGDTFLVLDIENRMLYLYKTVDTLLCPSMAAFDEHKDGLYFWSETTGMMYILSAVSEASFARMQDKEDAEHIIESLEGYLQPL